MPNFGKL